MLLLRLWLAAALLVAVPVRSQSTTCPATITRTQVSYISSSSRHTTDLQSSKTEVPWTPPSLPPHTTTITTNVTLIETSTSTGVSTTKVVEHQVVAHQVVPRSEAKLVTDISAKVQRLENDVVNSCPGAVVVTVTAYRTSSGVPSAATSPLAKPTSTSIRRSSSMNSASLASSKSPTFRSSTKESTSVRSGSSSSTRSSTNTNSVSSNSSRQSSSSPPAASIHTISHESSSSARPGNTVKVSSPSATAVRLTSTPELVSRSQSSTTAGRTRSAEPSSLLGSFVTAVGSSTITLSVGQGTLFDGKTFSLDLNYTLLVNGHPSSISSSEGFLLSHLSTSSSEDSNVTPYLNSQGPTRTQKSSTFVPTASDGKWNSEMSKHPCKPPCTQKIAVLTLKHKQTVQYWDITTSFCREVDGVTYASSTTIRPPALTKSELGFVPLEMPKNIKNGDVIMPDYAPAVTDEPPFMVTVATGATPCPTPNHPVGHDGKCGTNQRCPDAQCCGANSKCGSDSPHCFEGCKRDFGSCWKNATAGFLNETEVFGNDVLKLSSTDTAMVWPPDQGRGVEFASWAYCWNCKDLHHNFFAAGAFGGGGGGGGGGGCGGGNCGGKGDDEDGSGGGGCIYLWTPFGDISLNCLKLPCIIGCHRGKGGGCKVNCHNDPKHPKDPVKPDDPDPKSSTPSSIQSSSSSRGTRSVPYQSTSGLTFTGGSGTDGQDPANPSTPAIPERCSTITMSGTLPLTMSVPCVVQSCPIKVDVSPLDDQGEDGAAPSCPYIGNMTLSINDDQGEDGVPLACPYQANMTIEELGPSDYGSDNCSSTQKTTVNNVVSLCNVAILASPNTGSAKASSIVCTGKTTVKITGSCLMPTTTKSMGKTLTVSGSSASGDVLSCGSDSQKRSGGDMAERGLVGALAGVLADAFCVWTPPKRKSTTTSNNVPEQEILLDLAGLANGLSSARSRLSAMTTMRNLVSVESEIGAFSVLDIQWRSTLSLISSKLGQVKTYQHEQDDWSAFKSITSMLDALETAKSVLARLTATAPASYWGPPGLAGTSTCISTCTAPTNPYFGGCRLQIWGEAGTYQTSCLCESTSLHPSLLAYVATVPTVAPIYTICGHPACPNDPTLCITSAPGPCMPPIQDGIGWCTLRTGLHMSTATCACETSNWSAYSEHYTTYHPQPLDLCGTSVCPNQIASISDSSSFYGWGQNCTYQAPKDPAHGVCTRSAKLTKGKTEWKCDCSSPSIERPNHGQVEPHTWADVVTICNRPACVNELQVVYTVDGQLTTDNVITVTAPGMDHAPPAFSETSSAGSCEAASPTFPSFPNCTLQTFMMACSARLNCFCPNHEVGFDPAPTTSCGLTRCRNQVATWNQVPTSIPASCSGTITSLAAREAPYETARKGQRDHYVQTTTQLASPGSTPTPVARDTSTPAQPTILGRAAASTDGEGREIVTHRGSQKVTTTSSSLQIPKAKMDEMAERLRKLL